MIVFGEHALNPELVARVSKVYRCDGEWIFDIFMSCPVYHSNSSCIAMYYITEIEANSDRLAFITKINRKHVGV